MHICTHYLNIKYLNYDFNIFKHSTKSELIINCDYNNYYMLYAYNNNTASDISAHHAIAGLLLFHNIANNNCDTLNNPFTPQHQPAIQALINLLLNDYGNFNDLCELLIYDNTPLSHNECEHIGNIYEKNNIIAQLIPLTINDIIFHSNDNIYQ